MGDRAPDAPTSIFAWAAVRREVVMMIMQFQVCRRGRDARWIVRLGNAVYGSYLDKEQALLDAIDAARDALQCGREAQVWLRDRATADRIF
jgi:hypothetical protein